MPGCFESEVSYSKPGTASSLLSILDRLYHYSCACQEYTQQVSKMREKSSLGHLHMGPLTFGSG